MRDAMKFCEWLTERQAGESRYRLPKASEVDRIISFNVDNLVRQKMDPESMGLASVKNLPYDIGYWIDGNRDFAWAKGSTPLPEHYLDTFRHQLNTAGAGQSRLEQIMNRAYLLHPDTSLNLDRLFVQLEMIDPSLKAEFVKLTDRLSILVQGGADPVDVDILRENILYKLLRSLSTPLSQGKARRSFFLSPVDRSLYRFRSSPSKFALHDIQHNIDTYIYAYISLTILEARREGQLDPCEGILLVRQLNGQM